MKAIICGRLNPSPQELVAKREAHRLVSSLGYGVKSDNELDWDALRRFHGSTGDAYRAVAQENDLVVGIEGVDGGGPYLSRGQHAILEAKLTICGVAPAVFRRGGLYLVQGLDLVPGNNWKGAYSRAQTTAEKWR